MKKQISGSIVAVFMICALWASTASAVSLTVTNNVHPIDAIFTGDNLVLGTIVTGALATASATGAVSRSVTSNGTSPADFSGTFASVDLSNPSITGVQGPNAAAGSIANWLETQNFNAAATATAGGGNGSTAKASAVSLYVYEQLFTVTAGTKLTYDFTYDTQFDVIDPKTGKYAGLAAFEFGLVSTDAFGNILAQSTPFLDYLTTTSLGNAGQISLNFTDGYGYWQAITGAEATASVPEPGTILLLGAGMAGLVAYRRRRV
jgi:hypothetical protein